MEALEDILDLRPWTDRDKDFYRFLSQPSLLLVIEKTATDRAHRRWLHDRGRVAGRWQGNCWYVTTGDGWFWHTTESEQIQLAQQEVRELVNLLIIHSNRDALERWADEPDLNDWPQLNGRPDGFSEFCDRLARARQAMVVHRNSDDGIARQWRRDHPEWRPDMTPDEYDVWELMLADSDDLDNES